MTPADIERMAQEAGDAETDSRGRVTFSFDSYGLARFATLVEAAERERCAKVCESQKFMVLEPLRMHTAEDERRRLMASLKHVAAAIRGAA